MRKKLFSITTIVLIIVIIYGIYFAQVVVPHRHRPGKLNYNKEELEMIQNLSSSDKKFLDSLLIER